MTPEDAARLAEIECRSDRATPGPWAWEAADGSLLFLNVQQGVRPIVLACDRCKACERSNTRCFWPEAADGDFIAAARSDVPFLLGLVRRLAAELRELRGVVGSLMPGDDGRNSAQKVEMDSRS